MRQRSFGMVRVMEADMGKDLAFLEAIPGKLDFSGPVAPRWRASQSPSWRPISDTDVPACWTASETRFE